MSIFKKKKKFNEGDNALIAAGTSGEGAEPVVTGLYSEEAPPEINKKYKAAALGVSIIKYAVLAVFFVYFMVMTVAFSSQINIENFRYIIKDMNFRLPVNPEDYGEIYYISDIEHSFALYRGDFVSAGRSRFDITDMTGKSVQSTDLGYVRPHICTSEKYLLIYDLSGNAFCVCNSFSPLYNEVTDYPITCAAINDNGYFMIASKDAEYRSVITVYNSDMKKIYHYKTNSGYIFDLLFNNDGTFLLYTVSAENGVFVSRTISGDIRSDEKKTVFERKDTAFISAKRSDQTHISVLCDGKVMFFGDGELIGEYDHFPRLCRRFEAGGGYTAAVFSTGDTGADSYLYVFDNKGEVIHTAAATSDVQKLYINNGCLYQLYTDRIKKTDLKTFKVSEHISEYEVRDLVFVDEEIVLLATPSRAYPMSVYDGFTEVTE